MFGSYLVELVIGLCFLFAVLGIVTSAITEIVLSVTAVRSTQLQQWLTQWTSQMLEGSPANSPLGDPGAFLERLIKHPLIATQSRSEIPNKAELNASYLQPDQLAAAFLQTLAMPFDSTCIGKDLATAETQLRQHISTLQTPSLKNALEALLNSAVGKATDGTALVEQVRKETAAWIDSSMNRVEGWTKRRAKLISLIAASCVCVFFNVDMVSVLRTLSSDPKVREQMAAKAVESVKSECPAPGSPLISDAATQFSSGASQSQGTPSSPPPSSTANSAQNVNTDLQDKVACLQKVSAAAIDSLGPLTSLGIGWDSKPKFVGASGWSWAGWFFLWLIGVAGSAIAASMGGDFWFKWIGDVVRLTGYKPAPRSP